ncbi:MAG: ATP-binding protein, partial [Planctomycetota bacterium]
MSESSVLNQLDKTISVGIRLGAFEDRLGRKLLQLYHRGILDPWVVGRINNRVSRRLREEAFATTPFKPARLDRGDLILGFDEHGNSVRSRVQYMNAGSLMVANTGSGKTTLISFYAVQMAQCVKGMWLVDLRKKEFRLLQPEFIQKGIDLIVVRGRKFKINPLQVPDGTDPYEYASISADTLVKVLNLPPRASVLLSSTIVKLYKGYGIFDGNRKYPTLFHLFETVRTDKTANPQAKQAILDNLEAILLALGTGVLGYYSGWPIHELAKRHMAFELTGQPEAGKDLVLNYLVVSEFISRVSRGISNRDMDLWMTIDEGQRLFSQRKEIATHSGNSITDLAGLVRGTGTGLYISVLTPDDLSSKIPSFTSTKIIGRCGSVSEYMAAGRFMGLDPEQITWCVHHMAPGLFVGQVGDGPWRYPFLFKVPKLNKLRPVSDKETDDTLKSLADLATEPVEFSDWSATPRVTIADDKKKQPASTGKLSPSAFRLLQAIVNNPMLPSSHYVKLARISPNT